MSSQYSKRKKKETKTVLGQGLIEAANEIVESMTVKEEVPKVVAGAVYTAVDVFYDEAARKHKAVVLTYNPQNLQAKVEEVRDISRSVALVHENNKYALKQLTKKIKSKD